MTLLSLSKCFWYWTLLQPFSEINNKVTQKEKKKQDISDVYFMNKKYKPGKYITKIVLNKKILISFWELKYF